MQARAGTSSDLDRLGIEADPRGFDYVNHFEVGFGHFEVLLRFAQAFDGTEVQMRRTSVVMTPAYAKALLLMLSSAIDRFEAVHGELPVAGAASNDPAAAP
ncbi:DUF3467 domain-containing protein [Piscinibacter sakaiensis]|uniref:DUF3467 domain-containing protein n=1 Tax=Piscinibacter sakaiensis TaxID=1547922 RepID=UPI003AAAFC0E